MPVLNGIDLDSLGAQMEPVQSGKVLLLDTDFLVYQAAATVKTLPTAIRRFYTLVMTEMFLTGCKTCKAFITPTGSAKCQRYLYPTVLPYQGQRKSRPELPLKGPLKEHLILHPEEYAQHGIRIMASSWFEADDLMIIHAHDIGEQGIIHSGDKDLRLTPGPWWDSEIGRVNVISDRFGYLYWDADAPSNARCKGRGTKFFWAQMLMGDSADNVRGIIKLDGKLCGPRGAYKFLKDFKTEQEAANAVVAAYARANQNVLAEAEMMWLRRSTDDSAYLYLMEVLTDDALIQWVQQLHEYHVQHIKWVQEQAENGED